MNSGTIPYLLWAPHTEPGMARVEQTHMFHKSFTYLGLDLNLAQSPKKKKKHGNNDITPIQLIKVGLMLSKYIFCFVKASYNYSSYVWVGALPRLYVPLPRLHVVELVKF